MSPICSHWYRRTGTAGCRFLRRPRHIALSVRPRVESGASSALAALRSVQRYWVRRTLRRSTSAVAPREWYRASHL